MAEFPTGFAEERVELTRDIARGLASEYAYMGYMGLKDVQKAGFVVTAGVQPEDLPDLAAAASRDAVREYWPDDAPVFMDEGATAHWLAQNRGRGVMMLRRNAEDGGDRVAGYAFAEAIPTTPDALERGTYGELRDRGCQTALAVRLGEAVGYKLAASFIKAAVLGTMVCWDACRIGIMDYGSNERVARALVGPVGIEAGAGAGAKLVACRDDVRPTLRAGRGVLHGERYDTQLFFGFERT
jgi:hypothetical protein